MTLFERSWAIMKMFDRKVFENQGIRPEDSPLFMAEIQPLLDQLAAQKKGGWKKEGPHYVNPAFPGYNVRSVGDLGGRYLNLNRDEEPDGAWDPYMDDMPTESNYSHLPLLSHHLAIADARMHRPTNHPDWIARALGMDPDDVWGEYEQHMNEKMAEYEALSPQKRRHVQPPDQYERGGYYV